MTRFGDALYSLEELVAEIGTCYLQWHTGITEEFVQSVAYIEGWLKVLRGDKWFVFSAAREAEKAVAYILNLNEESKEEEE